MLSPDSVTNWVFQLRDGEEDIPRALWEGYFARLVGLAERTQIRRRGGRWMSSLAGSAGRGTAAYRPGKLEGYSNEELAQRLNKASRTVERKLRKIRHNSLKEMTS